MCRFIAPAGAGDVHSNDSYWLTDGERKVMRIAVTWRP
jgi:hypothetical protein